LSALPVLDPRPLQELLDMGAEPDLVWELMALFHEDTPARMAALATALEARDSGKALHEAHQLKGALGNLGLLRFAETAADIETHLREGRLEPASRLAQGLPGAYAEAREALRAAFPEA
jgi:hypothetical protein